MEIRQGIDMTSVRRIKQTIERRGRFFLDRVFTSAEQAYCESKRMKYEHYAARFAAKEAVIKALQIKKNSQPALRDIEIRRKATGRPFIYLNQKVRNALGLPRQCQIELSLSHERKFAIATVLLIQNHGTSHKEHVKKRK